MQLKILQALPFFLQNYGDDIQGELLASVVNICTTLQASKNGIVNNTAAATLQQLVVTVFDKVVAEDKQTQEIPTVGYTCEDDGHLPLKPAAYDAYRIFNDLCLLTESRRPLFLTVTAIPQTFGLELVESVLSNHAAMFLIHPEQANVLRSRLMPFIIQSMSPKLNFAATVRVGRILYTLLRHHISILASESEVALGLLTHILDNDNTLWRRALCMEVFRGIFSDAALIRKIYSLYDSRPSGKKVLGDLVAAFVRLSSEKPSVIGLGSQSTVPSANPYTNEDDGANQTMVEAGGLGIISSPASNREYNAGISVEWSSMRVPCIDQLDKADAPSIPESYIYGLTLTCINSFSEGLAKFILPLTMPEHSKRRNGKSSVPLNPLDNKEHPMYEEVKICEQIVDSCWPAIMATCSTFLSACLGAEYFHGLIRSFQKFTHVAGLLRLSTPRDAFLTTLGKASVPPHVLTASAAVPQTPNTPATEGGAHGIFKHAKGLLSVDSIASSQQAGHPSFEDSGQASLNTRNLLALRALLNLGIALGPTFDTAAWLIILETLQQADYVLFSSTGASGKFLASPGLKQDGKAAGQKEALTANFGSEIKAVETAASRLCESTQSFPNESLVAILQALCSLFGGEDEQASTDPKSPLATARKSSYTHRRVSSISISSTRPSHGDFFALAKLSEIASINIERLATHLPTSSGWNVLVDNLIAAATSTSVQSNVRAKASEVLVRLALQAANHSLKLEDNDTRIDVQKRVFQTFHSTLVPLLSDERKTTTTDVEIHHAVLEAVKSMLEHCGETLIEGWDIAFDIIRSVFVQQKDSRQGFRTRSLRLVRSAFGSLELICSDFLSAIPYGDCFLTLVDTLALFCKCDELNICLTTVTFFWVLSDHFTRIDHPLLERISSNTSVDEQELVTKAKSGNTSTSDSALWLILLLRLTGVTTDERLELRNSAIHTMLRILDANGEQLSPSAWSTCFHSVIFPMLINVSANLSSEHSGPPSKHPEHAQEWIETTIVVLDGVSNLLATFIYELGEHHSFPACWAKLLAVMSDLIEHNSLDINTAVYNGLRQIMANCDTDDKSSAKLDAEAINRVWDMWSSRLPIAPPPETNAQKEELNQDCLLAYISCSREMYRLMRAEVTKQQTETMLRLFHDTITAAQLGQYSNDVDYPTNLQKQTLESLSMLSTDIAGVPALVIRTVAQLVAFPFTSNAQHITGNMRDGSYVSLSKAAMKLLEELVEKHALADSSVFEDNVMENALNSLAKSISLKYGFGVTTKSEPLWKVSSTTSINVVRSILPALQRHNLADDTVSNIWQGIVAIANGILSADCDLYKRTADKQERNDGILEDESFDITSFEQLRDLMIPGLGNSIISDTSRRSFMQHIFHVSIIHEPHPYSLPDTSKPEELLSDLYAPLLGRTTNPSPTPRTKMAYVALEELAELVSANPSPLDFSEERIRLAAAAAPYFILRCGMTLKTYVADQPLRGLCPQPRSQRVELLWVLRRALGLRVERHAEDDDKFDSGGGEIWHLRRLYMLLVRIIGQAARDQEVRGLVEGCLEVVGN